MRILLAIHNAYTDHTSGAAHSMRIIMQWLGEAGHDVRVLSTARFDARPPSNLAQHLVDHEIEAIRRPPPRALLRVSKRPANLGPGRPIFEFTFRGVPVTMLATGGASNTPMDRFESEQFLFYLDERLRSFEPDIVLTYGGHPVLHQAMRRSQESGALVVLTLRNYGFDDLRHYEHVDAVFTTSPFLSRHYPSA